MELVNKNTFKIKSICLTPYRALLLLKHLMVSPLNKAQINDLFTSNELINQELSKETLRVILNSLKEFGCKFSRPSSSNNFEYKLLENPFCLKLSKTEVDLLNKFRKNTFDNKNWRKILSSNSLIDKICMVINDEETVKHLKNHSQLLDIDKKLLSELEKYCTNKSTVIFEYLSGKNLSEFEMQVSFLKYERNRLYVWGYSSKYDDFSYLRVDKIKSVKVVKIGKDKIKTQNLCIKYKNYDKNYYLSDNETLCEETEDALVIEYKAENKFYAIQKFSEMGGDCEIIYPQSFRDEFINTIKDVLKEYDGK